jgi:hypothetical protein
MIYYNKKKKELNFFIIIRQSTFVIPIGLQPIAQIPQVPPSKPMVTFSPSTMIGTLRAPLECFSMMSICLGSLTTL